MSTEGSVPRAKTSTEKRTVCQTKLPVSDSDGSTSVVVLGGMDGNESCFEALLLQLSVSQCTTDTLDNVYA